MVVCWKGKLRFREAGSGAALKETQVSASLSLLCPLLLQESPNMER